MLAQSQGELWHEVEPQARAKPGWVAFRPCPPCPTATSMPIMAMRSLIPGASALSSVADHICTREDALEAIWAIDAASLAIQRAATDHHVYERACEVGISATALRATLVDRYAAAELITTSDAKRIGDLVGRVDFTVQLERDAAGTVAIGSTTAPFYAAMGRLLAGPRCGPRPGGRFKWWLIPLVLIGTGLVVYGETKGGK